MRFLFILVLAFLVSCKDTKAPDYSKKNSKSTLAKNHPGERLLKAQCYACHNPATPHEGRLAPPMIAIKKHYINDETTKEDFINEVVSFTINPSEENAKLHGAVKRFGLMPKQFFKEEDVKQIAEYLFDYEIEEPKWFQEHHNGEKGKGKHQKQKRKRRGKNNKEIGYSIASKTKQELAKNLIGTIQQEGTLAALKFCNVEAYPITNNMAKELNATIKRVSNKPRNPNNKANQEESEYIQQFQNNINNGEDYEPIVKNLAQGKTRFYAPIVTNQLCLQCHGKPDTQIEPQTLATIKELYPKDLAVGYDVNQVRGLWQITF